MGPGQQGTTFFDRGDLAISVALDAPAYFGANTQGLLLLHHHNVSERRAEVIGVRSAWQATVHLPIVQTN
jgi:hypothetical protein